MVTAEGASVRAQGAATPTAVLRAEHEAILGVLAAMTRALDEGGRFDETVFWQDAVRFLESFADRGHHGKEESVLFPRLEGRGLPSGGGPIAVMLAEHEQGRVLLRAIAKLLPALADATAEVQQRFRRAVREYCALLALHINKENGVLFPLAERLLSAEDQHEILQRFALWEEGAHGERAQLLALAERVRHAA